jgi:hypothetical protein
MSRRKALLSREGWETVAQQRTSRTVPRGGLFMRGRIRVVPPIPSAGSQVMPFLNRVTTPRLEYRTLAWASLILAAASGLQWLTDAAPPSPTQLTIGFSIVAAVFFVRSDGAPQQAQN